MSVFGLTLTLILTIFGEHKKGELYILKMVGVSKFKKVLWKFVYNSIVMFFNIFLFCLKGYFENLTGREIVRAAEEINREGQNF